MTASEVSVRAAAVEDAPLLAAFTAELLAHWLQPMPCPEDMMAARLRREIAGPTPRMEALIATVDGAAAGVLMFTAPFSLALGGPRLSIEELYVRESARRQGVGRALMEALAGTAKRRGVRLLDWRTEASAEDALAFYRRIDAERLDGKLTLLLRGRALRRLGG